MPLNGPPFVTVPIIHFANNHGMTVLALTLACHIDSEPSGV